MDAFHLSAQNLFLMQKYDMIDKRWVIFQVKNWQWMGFFGREAACLCFLKYSITKHHHSANTYKSYESVWREILLACTTSLNWIKVGLISKTISIHIVFKILTYHNSDEMTAF